MKKMIHPTALISDDAIIGENVSIGPYSIVHAGVEIGPNSVIDAYCELGIPTQLATNDVLKLGSSCHIRSHSSFYIGSEFGDGLVTGHQVTVRENTKAGNGVQLGSIADIQGDCTLGNYVRTQSSVTIGKKSIIGNFVWMFPGVLLTNDPNPPSNDLIGVTVDDYVVIAVKSTILPGVRVGIGSFVSAHSLVSVDVPDNSLVSGVPAKVMCKASDMRMKNNLSIRAYPWMKRFTRGYPDSIIEQWGNGVFSIEF